MKAPHFSLASTRAKIITVVIVMLVVLTISVLALSYRTYQTSSSASASGPFSIIWGDPYCSPGNPCSTFPTSIGQGSGWESFTVNGDVAKWTNATGYYVYTNFTLQGRLHGQWSSSGNNYVLDANLSLARYENGYQNIIVNPSANSFTVSFLDYTASLTINGATRHINSVAGMKAAAPGYFALQGQYRTTTFILYAPALGDPQFVFQWSQNSQTVHGIQLPAADQFSQTVTMSYGGW